ncbi:MAG: hypothetical protein KDF54_11575 [Hydrogenophaga sp.]|nr:hypothetical protein [Hydrogenophaga sp.]
MAGRGDRSGFAGAAVLALAGALGLVLVLWPMGMACVPLQCGADGLRFGLPIFLAALGIGLVGQAFRRMTARPAADASNSNGFFASLATGVVVLLSYVFARSLLNHLVDWDLPVTRAEILVLVALAGAYLLVHRRDPVADPGADGGLWVDLALMLVLCVVVADRELPREIMLSSDPDMHVFFGWQVERMGGVPFHQGDWGPEGLHYPAGSGVVLFLWKSLSGLLPRQLLVVLPVLFMFAAMLLVAEQAGARLFRHRDRLLLKIAAVAATAAGFMFPLYMQYAHLEGAARQLSVLPAALFLAWALEVTRSEDRVVGRAMLLPTLTIFALGSLNPANVVVPGLVLMALWLRALVQRRQAWPPLVIGVMALGLLLALAPYYHGLLGIVAQARVDTVIYDDRLIIKTLPQLIDGVWATWTGQFPTVLREASVLFDEKGRPVFLTLGAVFLSAAMLIRGRKTWPTAAGWWALIVFVAALFLVYGATRSLLDDRRFFLLGPYVFFSMTQYKAMLIVLLMVLVMERLVQVPWLGGGLAIAAAGGMVFGVMVLVRAEQPMYLAPRKDYCGVYGCLEEDDRRLLETFEAQVREGKFTEADGRLPKVLLPNAFKNTEHESWVLPVGSARVLPFYEVLPAAFYYYQGELDYHTASYREHVCERFDREWLKARRILYVYLPSNRQDACIAGMNGLIQSEDIVLQSGQAYLLRLR